MSQRKQTSSHDIQQRQYSRGGVTVNKIFCLPEGREVEGYKISWCDGERECIVKSVDGRGSFHYPLQDVLHYLNNGTWIVKNSKV